MCMLPNLYGQDLDQWQRERISLSGTWQSSLGDCRLPGTADENRLGDGRHAAQETSRLTRLYPYFGQVTYERDVTIPASWDGKRLRLVMERTKPSTLWIDGDSIGSYGHIYAPHCYELPLLTAGTRQVVHLLNFSQANSLSWRDLNGTMPEPQLVESAVVDITTTDAVDRVWMASPDVNGGAVRDLPFEKTATGIRITIPSIKYWDMIVLEQK